MRTKTVLIILMAIFSVSHSFSQVTIGFAGGLSSAKGDAFFSIPGEDGSFSGIDFSGYLMYRFDKKISAGLAYNTSMLSDKETYDSDLIPSSGYFNLSLTGLKVNYNFFDEVLTPFVSVTAGVGKFKSPEVIIFDFSGNSDDITIPASSFSGFGLRPEIGLNYNNFTISGGYILPIKNSISNVKASGLDFSIGYQYQF